jgi:hypothetical protein
MARKRKGTVLAHVKSIKTAIHPTGVSKAIRKVVK